MSSPNTRRQPTNQAVELSPDGAGASAQGSQGAAAEWRPPLQRHTLPGGVIAFVTVRVRIMDGDSEHDYITKFPGDQTLYVQMILDAVAARVNISPENKSLFGLWVVGRDLELQLRPKMDIFELMFRWTMWTEKYTHYPECGVPQHPINRHWFVYRREISITKQIESTVTEEACIRLLYGEAKRNVLTGRFPCTVQEAIQLAGIQLQIMQGDSDPERHPYGYLTQNDTWKQIIPFQHHRAMGHSKWEAHIGTEYAKHKGNSVMDGQLKYLAVVRKWPAYGCAFFPVSQEVPPFGFFEFRIQRWLIGISSEHLVVIDKDKSKYVLVESVNDLKWKYSPDTVVFHYMRDGTVHQLRVVSPQSALVHNVALRMKYLHKKREIGMVSAISGEPASARAPSAVASTSMGMPMPMPMPMATPRQAAAPASETTPKFVAIYEAAKTAVPPSPQPDSNRSARNAYPMSPVPAPPPLYTTGERPGHERSPTAPSTLDRTPTTPSALPPDEFVSSPYVATRRKAKAKSMTPANAQPSETALPLLPSETSSSFLLDGPLRAEAGTAPHSPQVPRSSNNRPLSIESGSSSADEVDPFAPARPDDRQGSGQAGQLGIPSTGPQGRSRARSIGEPHKLSLLTSSPAVSRSPSIRRPGALISAAFKQPSFRRANQDELEFTMMGPVSQIDDGQDHPM
ncbi:FERM central domain-containing protein [Polychytrium aggregatum]|uniref:FERM central domain-containing protein n=1 Tax=Polychytrium aggregatum TaxID=110093 RepID=UPI0022FE91A0|nr:FERM central domain-containing protein [Polychytrium aggregatum]KAI9208087.1 FERM central domain-containing protein [Polychytrium aggregatum]